MGDMSVEPSMEEILSSIKRIIAEEGEGAAPTRQRRGPRPTTALPETDRAETDRADDDSVLELSDPMPAPVAQPPDPVPSPVESPRTEPILSPRTADASRGSLDALSRMIVKPEPGSDGTLEGLVREMIRPMLRDWFDAHLPAMVETMVAKEIARIASQD